MGKSLFFLGAGSGNERKREGVEREALTSLKDLRSSSGRLVSRQDLKLEYSSRVTRGHQNQEFSSDIQAECLGGHVQS